MASRSLILAVVAMIGPAALLTGRASSAATWTFLGLQSGATRAPRVIEKPLASGGYIYVSNVTHASPPFVGSVDLYPVGSNGDVAPTAVISGSNTLLTQVDGIVVDGSGEIFVANDDSNTIVGFAPGSNGNVSPNIIIGGSNTGLASPFALALDHVGNLYVANCGKCNYGPPGPSSVEEFSAGSNGNATPIKKISGSRTQLDTTEGIAVDGRGYIYVANSFQNAITIYSPRAHGNVPPLRVISGSRTRVDVPVGIAVDANGLYVTAATAGYISRFAPGAGGDVPPRSASQVNWSNSQQILSGIISAPDATLYVAGFYTPLVAQYAARTHGTPSPLTEIKGPHTRLVIPTFVFVR